MQKNVKLDIKLESLFIEDRVKIQIGRRKDKKYKQKPSNLVVRIKEKIAEFQEAQRNSYIFDMEVIKIGQKGNSNKYSTDNRYCG